jgi:energy-coupling factor transporter ATP-binding protein EcfA2
MRLQRLEIENFRGFDGFDLPVNGGSLFLIGENAGGKTSLLTAIARALGRDRGFTRADFRDLQAPIEITATLNDLSAPQRAILGNNVEFATGSPARLRVQARAIWDPAVEDAEAEHLYPKNGNRSSRAERDAIPILWLPAVRDVGRFLQFGVPRNVMGQLLEQLPIGPSIDRAIDEIADASEKFAQDPELQRFLSEARDELAHMLPDVAQDAYAIGRSGATGRDLLRQFELLVKHVGEPIGITQQSSGLAQLTVFVFALKLAAADPGAILLVDEPEVSLHPQAQRSLVRGLRALQAQTIIATHSSNLLERGDPRQVARVRSTTRRVELAFPSTLTDEESKRLARFTNPHAAEAFFARTIVLVEGDSDRLAVETLAERKGRNLDAESVSVVPINGASKAETYIALFGPHGFQIKLAGLCDEGDEGFFARGLDRSGIALQPSRTDMQNAGFFVCVRDLEEELIRSLGANKAEQVIDSNGDLGTFRQFQRQSAWQGQSLSDQIVGFIKAKRKVEYAPLLVDALDLANVPAPLEGVLAVA